MNSAPCVESVTSLGDGMEENPVVTQCSALVVMRESEDPVSAVVGVREDPKANVTEKHTRKSNKISNAKPSFFIKTPPVK